MVSTLDSFFQFSKPLSALLEGEAAKSSAALRVHAEGLFAAQPRNSPNGCVFSWLGFEGEATGKPPLFFLRHPNPCNKFNVVLNRGSCLKKRIKTNIPLWISTPLIGHFPTTQKKFETCLPRMEPSQRSRPTAPGGVFREKKPFGLGGVPGKSENIQGFRPPNWQLVGSKCRIRTSRTCPQKSARQ